MAMRPLKSARRRLLYTAEALERRVLLSADGFDFPGLIPPTYDVSITPLSFALADVNGDGYVDLIAPGGSVGVLLNKRDGTFARRVSYRLDFYGTYSAEAVAAADVDGDGRVDLLAGGVLRNLEGSDLPNVVLATDTRYSITGPAGAKTLTLTAGSITFLGDISATYPGLTINIGPGARGTFNMDQHLGGLNIAGTATLAAGRTIVTTSLSIDTAGGGKLDLADGTWIVDYTGSSPLADVQGWLAGGYAQEQWNGSGICSGVAAAARNMGLGYADDGDRLTVKYTLYGDADLDGVVNLNDLIALSQNYARDTGVTWGGGDSSYDGATSLTDLLRLAQNYNKTMASPQPAGATAALASPISDAGPEISDLRSEIADQPDALPADPWLAVADDADPERTEGLWAGMEEPAEMLD